MKRAGLIVGLAALVLIASLGYFWWSRSGPDVSAGAQVEPPAAGRQADVAKAPETSAVPAPEPAPVPDTARATETAPPAAVARLQSGEEGNGAKMGSDSAPKPADPDRLARAVPREPAPAATAAEEPVPAKPRVKTRQVAPPLDVGPAAILPSFDVVRLEPSGEAVLAGRATPGSTVRLIDGTQYLSEVVTDSNGEWVIVLRTPLAPGAHELSLESRLTSGEILLSENVVVVSVPAPALVAKNRTPPTASPPIETADAASTGAPAPAPAPTGAAPAPVPTPTGAAPAPVPAPTGAAPLPARTIETVRPLAVLMPRSGTGASRIIQAPEPVPETLGAETLLLETVDYDGEGRAVIGGRGAPGAALILYLDGRPAGSTVIGPDGRWRTQLEGEVSFGVHSLRIDQVNGVGKVVARVESPFSRASLVTAVGDETAVIVQPGNSLWRIARRVYGEGLRYSVIYAANRNQIGDPDLIYPGQIFVVPAEN